jgi:hypothetical protein
MSRTTFIVDGFSALAKHLEVAAVAFAFGDRIADDQQRFNEWRSHWEQRTA